MVEFVKNWIKSAYPCAPMYLCCSAITRKPVLFMVELELKPRITPYVH